MKDMRFNGLDYASSVIKIGGSYIVCYPTLGGLILNRSKNYPMSHNYSMPCVV